MSPTPPGSRPSDWSKRGFFILIRNTRGSFGFRRMFATAVSAVLRAAMHSRGVAPPSRSDRTAACTEGAPSSAAISASISVRLCSRLSSRAGCKALAAPFFKARAVPSRQSQSPLPSTSSSKKPAAAMSSGPPRRPPTRAWYALFWRDTFQSRPSRGVRRMLLRYRATVSAAALTSWGLACSRSMAMAVATKGRLSLDACSSRKPNAARSSGR
mmetsp:Transcript_9315/g.21046  ORF Transcript_9315/g.21046 Transcript_9315/m.21046 type:complete len:213 (-) Transcript_9315:374-1012(-)